MTKDELIEALEDEREKMLDAIDGLSDEELQRPGANGEWSVKDILIHLSAWEAEMVKLLWQAKQGQKPTSAHFNTPDVDARNQEWFEAYRGRELDRVLADFAALRQQTVRRVEAFSEADLNDVQHFSWLGGRPLWEWVAGDSFEHEAEHAAQIREWRARLNQ
jgi:hypothetical protein